MASGGVLGVTALFLGVFFLIYALTPKSLKTLLKLVSVTGVGAAMVMEKARDCFCEAVDNWLWDGPQLSSSGWVLLLLSVTSFLIGSYVTKWKTEVTKELHLLSSLLLMRHLCYSCVISATHATTAALSTAPSPRCSA